MDFFNSAVTTMSTLVTALGGGLGVWGVINLMGGDLHAAVWSCAAYTVLLCFSLFKTGSVAKSILNAH